VKKPRQKGDEEKTMPNPSGRRLIVCVLICGLVLPLAAHATIVQSLSERAMVTRAHLIVDATVLSKRSLTVGKAKRIVTDVVLRVKQFIKGRTAARLVTVRVMGGTVGNTTAHVAGETELTRNQRVLLFLAPAPPSSWDRSPTYYYIVGMSLGAYQIVSHPQTKQLHAIRQTELPTQIKRTPTGSWHTIHPTATVASVPLIALKQRIYKQMQSLVPPSTKKGR
jgi:hypothetical protein